MNKKVEDFSNGLWRLRVELIKSSVDEPKMDVADITPFLHESGTDEPLIVRVKGTYIAVRSSSAIPYKVIALPEEYEEFLGFDLPQEVYILIPKNQDKMKSVLNPDESYGWEIPDDRED